MIKKHYLFWFIIYVAPLSVIAQEAVLPSGGDASGSSGTVSFSIGQVDYISQSSSEGSVYQGVQQAFEIFTVNVLSDKYKNISVSAYPNPTSQNLSLKIDNFLEENYLFQLFNFNGKLILDRRIESDITHVSLEAYPSASYFLKVMNSKGEEIKSFKIIKN